MALTFTQIQECRDKLSEDNALLDQISDEVVSATNGTMVRRWDGIDEPLQDQCREFLKTIISANNANVVELTGTQLPYSINGEYFDVHETANGYPVRKLANNDFTLQVVESAGNYHWQVSNEWDEILYTSNAQAATPVDIDDAVWTPVGKVYVSLVDSRVMEDMFETDATGPFYTTSGTAASAEVSPSTGIYATVVDPKAEDGKVRGGTWRGGKVWTQKDQNGTWTVFQTLHLLNEANAYIRLGLRKTEHTREEQRLYERIPEANMNTLIETLANRGSFAVSDVQGRKTATPGIYDVTLTVLSVTGTGYLVVGKRLTAYSTEETRLYYGIPEDEVTAKVNELAQLEDYAVVDSTARKTKWDGVFDVYVTMLTVNTGGTSFEVGRKETEYTLEITLLYPNVKQTDVAGIINGTALGEFVLVGSVARRTRWDGVFDVRVTMRQLKAAAGATLIGSRTPGFIRRDVYLIRNVADAAVAATVAGLAGQALIEDVRSSFGAEPGYRDVFYTQMILPAAYTEAVVAYESSEGDWGPSEWKFVTNYTPQRDSSGDVVDHESYLQALPIAYAEAALVRKVTMTTTKTYSASAPGTPSGSASASGVDKTSTFSITGGKTQQLPNGMWVSEVITTVKAGWGTSG